MPGNSSFLCADCRDIEMSIPLEFLHAKSERKCEHGISFDDPCEDCDPPTCSRCAGSGEGQFDGTTCDSCKGNGIEQ